MPAAHNSGSVSASLIILIIVAAIIGLITGLVLESTGLGSRTIAIISGLVATLIASIARYKVMFLGAGSGPDESKIPGLVVTYALVAAIAGSLAAHDLSGYLTTDAPTAVLGALAGLLSAVLMAMLMVTYHTNTHGDLG